jgi:hypothetical protein
MSPLEIMKEIAGIKEHDGKWLGETYIFALRIPHARKDHLCAFCNEMIPKGMQHVVYTTTNVEGPGFEHWRLHGECYLSGEDMFSNSGRPILRWPDDF